MPSSSKKETKKTRRADEFILTLTGALVILMLPILFKINEYIEPNNQGIFLFGFMFILMSFFLGSIIYVFTRFKTFEYSNIFVLAYSLIGIIFLTLLSFYYVRIINLFIYEMFMWICPITVIGYTLTIKLITRWMDKKLLKLGKDLKNSDQDSLEKMKGLENHIDFLKEILENPKYEKTPSQKEELEFALKRFMKIKEGFDQSSNNSK